MPLCLDLPVLQVDTSVIHKVDTTPENLFSIWTVFAKCRDSVSEGRRLENLSWRLWNRETFCCENTEPVEEFSATSRPRDIENIREADDVPDLSGSIDSAVDEEALDFHAESAPVDIVRPRIRRQDSCASSRSRGRERHITPDDLSKMVASIIEDKEPFNAPLPNKPLSPPAQEKLKALPSLERTGSTTSESSNDCSEPPSMESQPEADHASEPEPEPQMKKTIITRGFSPALNLVARTISHPLKGLSPSHIPEPHASPAAKVVLPKKKQAQFSCGGSSGDDSFSDHDVEARKQAAVPSKMKTPFQLGGSSEDDGSLKSALHTTRATSLMNSQKKSASFNNQVTVQTFTSAVSDSETDYIDESAIEDDEDEWEEESAEESDKAHADKFEFKRVDSTAKLPRPTSMISVLMAQRAKLASASTSALPRTRTAMNPPSMVASPNDSDDAPLMMKRGSTRAPPTMRSIQEIPRSSAQPINAVATGIHHQAALSPRTTRRNMLATELTESLRRNLLWERSQKSSTANAVLKRRHTSHDIANLKQYPERSYMKKDNDANAGSLHCYVASGYHAEGW